MGEWWQLSKFDVVWLTLWISVYLWLKGEPHGAGEWVTFFASVFCGWLGATLFLESRRKR